MDWNKCSEKSPNEGDIVLLTYQIMGDRDIDVVMYSEGKYLYFCSSDDGNCYYEKVIEKPIAWIEAPKPYEGEE